PTLKSSPTAPVGTHAGDGGTAVGPGVEPLDAPERSTGPVAAPPPASRSDHSVTPVPTAPGPPAEPPLESRVEPSPRVRTQTFGPHDLEALATLLRTGARIVSVEIDA